MEKEKYDYYKKKYMKEIKKYLNNSRTYIDLSDAAMIISDLKDMGFTVKCVDGLINLFDNSNVKLKKYSRIATFNNIDDILSDVVSNSDGDFYKLPNGVYVHPKSLRYKVFSKNKKCVKCGIEGKFLALEKTILSDSKRYHLNMYALDSNGKEVLMTKDHIVPVSKGGTDDLTNLQTMCEKCNNKKGNS